MQTTHPVMQKNLNLKNKVIKKGRHKKWTVGIFQTGLYELGKTIYFEPTYKLHLDNPALHLSKLGFLQARPIKLGSRRKTRIYNTFKLV